MEIQEFRDGINPDRILRVGSDSFTVREVVRFRLDDGSIYFKCYLNDGHVFADDATSGAFLLVREVETPFQLPFPEQLEFDGKTFSFLFTAHAVAEEVWGEELFTKGASENFWDYSASDGSYLSMGTYDSDGSRSDFLGRMVQPSDVSLA